MTARLLHVSTCRTDATGVARKRQSEREARIREAVSRYGRVDPSPDDVLLRAWSRYHIDPEHTKGWHRDSAEVMARIDRATVPRTCKTCGDPLPTVQGRGHGNRRYCSDDCQRAVKRSQSPGRVHTKVTSEERRRLAAMYEEQELSVQEIANISKRSYMAIRRALAMEGVKMRPRVPRAHDPARRVA